MDGRERVRRAIDRTGPDRVPLLYFNRDKERSDLVMVDIQNHFGGPGQDTSPWGFTWEQLDGTMGQPTRPVLEDWDDLDRYTAPPVDAPGRTARAKAELARYDPGQYKLASLQLSGFTVMTILRGFPQLLLDLLEEPEQCARLADLVFGFETALIRVAEESGFDGIAFFDDWGSQSGMLVSPDLWRSFFKPRYAAQFAAAHQRGLDVYFHCCGDIRPILADFTEIGVDMMNISQPNLYDIPELGRGQGSQCFVMPVSYQTTSLSGSREDIFRDVALLVEHLGNGNGGLIGYVEEYSFIGMSEENYQCCIDAFLQLGRYGQ